MSTLNPSTTIIPGDTGACGYYRLIQVANMLQGIGKEVYLFPPTKFKGIGQDIIYTQRITSNGSLEPLLKFKESTGVKLIVDFDDLTWLYKGEGLPDYNYCKTKVDCKANTEAMEKYAAKVIDKATCSTEYLKNALSEFIDPKKITVMPNRLSVKDWLFDTATSIPEEDIFMYAGSATHYDNANKKSGDFNNGWIKYLSNKKVITMANTPYFIKPVAAFPGYPMSTYPRSFCNIARKAKFVIAPLADNVFNKCKSDLKLLESSAIGRVCLVSDFPDSPYKDAHPYQKIPVNATAQTIEFIVERAKEHYGEILKYQYEYLSKRWLDNHIQEYVDFLK